MNKIKLVVVILALCFEAYSQPNTSADLYVSELLKLRAGTLAGHSSGRLISIIGRLNKHAEKMLKLSAMKNRECEPYFDFLFSHQVKIKIMHPEAIKFNYREQRVLPDTSDRCHRVSELYLSPMLMEATIKHREDFNKSILAELDYIRTLLKAIN